MGGHRARVAITNPNTTTITKVVRFEEQGLGAEPLLHRFLFAPSNDPGVAEQVRGLSQLGWQSDGPRRILAFIHELETWILFEDDESRAETVIGEVRPSLAKPFDAAVAVQSSEYGYLDDVVTVVGIIEEYEQKVQSNGVLPPTTFSVNSVQHPHSTDWWSHAPTDEAHFRAQCRLAFRCAKQPRS